MFDDKIIEFSLSELDILKVLSSIKEKGTYTLVIYVPVERQIVVGRMGEHKFSKGYYVYNGSAFGKDSTSLGARVLRHLRKKKKQRWHIDYLLSKENVEIKAAIAAPTEIKMECEINQYLRDKLTAEIPVSGFGSSDCEKRCGSHLLYLGSGKDFVRRIAELYLEKVNTEIYVLNFLEAH